MCKGSVLIISLIIISCGAMGCGSPEERMHVKPGKEGEDNMLFQQQFKTQQPILEVKTTQEKAQEEKERETEATNIALMRSNPFLTKEEEEIFKETQGRLIIEDMILSAVMYSPPNSKVIIDGTILKEGDSIGSKKIVEIQPKAVIMKDEKSKREYILKTKGSVEKP